MGAALPFLQAVWYRIYGHEAFDTDRAYRALGYICHGETAWATLLFISHRGHTVAVQVHRCTALPVTCEQHDPRQLHRPLTETERLCERAGKFTNPDIGTDR